jgi:hypothetical protein
VERSGGGGEAAVAVKKVEVVAKEATTVLRPTMGAPSEAAVKKSTQTQRTETQYRTWVSSPLKIA